MMTKAGHGIVFVGLAVLLASHAMAQMASGGGETLVTGGSGFPPVPIKTNFAFDIDVDSEGHVTGHFDCFALAPDKPTGSGSGLFTDNVMYVTGRITSLEVVNMDQITFGGTATVTGLGAGLDLPFNCDATTGPHEPGRGSGGVGIAPGGPGARMTLSVSGLVFDETLTSGAIRFDRRRLNEYAKAQSANKGAPSTR